MLAVQVVGIPSLNLCTTTRICLRPEAEMTSHVQCCQQQTAAVHNPQEHLVPVLLTHGKVPMSRMNTGAQELLSVAYSGRQ